MNRPMQFEKTPAWPDPRHMSRQLESAHRSARTRARLARLELYHRASMTLRVGRLRDSDRDEIRFGVDEGLAIRVRPSSRDETLFAAASAFDPRGLITRALAGVGRSRSGDVWQEKRQPLHEDLDASLQLPDVGELRNWLDAARARLVDETGQRGVARVWLEVASTVESWAADGGIRATRARRRAWALAEPVPSKADGAGSRTPLIVASRHWEALPIDGWARLAADRAGESATRAGAIAQRRVIVLTPEAASILVQALVRVLHATDEGIGQPVGPGWQVTDEPAAPDAIFGGSFDDACFPTESRVLANGVRVSGTTAGPGCYRRASFRDPPAFRASNLIVSGPRRLDLPPGGLIVSGLSIHALGPAEWTLEVSGREISSGAAGGGFRGYVRTDPWRMVRRCTSGMGPPRRSHRGVITPALVFEHLEVVPIA